MNERVFSPQLNLGAVMHERHAPVRNRFSYAIFTLRLPLSQLDNLRVPLLGINRFNLLSVLNRDHGARDGSPLLPWVRAQLARHGIHSADGEVVLQTLPRLFGYLFNPVSFWYCYDKQGGLRAVICEVSNTFGEHHNYLVAHANHHPISDKDELLAGKTFHVSPFLPVRGEYRFRFRLRGEHVGVGIDYWDGGVKTLTTRLAGRDQALSTRSLLQGLARCPLLTFGVIARIHWQALRLVWRRVPFFRKPVYSKQVFQNIPETPAIKDFT